MNAGLFGLPGGFSTTSAVLQQIKGRDVIGVGPFPVGSAGVEGFQASGAYAATVLQTVLNVQGAGFAQFFAACTTTGNAYRTQVVIDGRTVYDFTTPGSAGNRDTVNPIGTLSRITTPLAIPSHFDTILFTSSFQVNVAIVVGGAANTLDFMAAYQLYQ